MLFSHKKDKNLFVAVLVCAGAIVTIWSLYLAIFKASSWWYTPFTLGSYALFSALNYRLYGKSTGYLLYRQPRKWLVLYFWLAIISFLIDVLFGRVVGKLWRYPRLDFMQNVFHVWLIGYPFALLSAAEMFWLISRPFKFAEIDAQQRAVRYLTWFARAAVILSIGSVIAVPLVWITTDTGTTGKLLLGTLVLATLGFDSLAYLLKKPSFLQAAANGYFGPIAALVLSAPLIAIVHELPNTLAQEWVYQNVPLIEVRLFGVNVLVLTLGWLFLTIIPLSIAHVIISRDLPRVP